MNYKNEYFDLWRLEMNHFEEKNCNNDVFPTTPSESECCGTGCNPCILDVHKRLVDEWHQRKVEKVMVSFRRNLLAPSEYKTFIVTSIGNTADDCILIRLDYKGKMAFGAGLFLNPGQHVILRVLSISRPFTPISWTINNLLFLAKLYPTGEFSRYLTQLKLGNEIDVRGPYGNFVYKLNSFKEIIMFCIGSGIAAFYPIVRSIVENELEETKVYLVAGFRSLSQIPLEKELRILSDYWNCRCTLQISQSDGKVAPTGLEVRKGRIEKSVVTDLLTSRLPESTLILICGTPEFNQFLEQWIKELHFLHYHVFK